MNKKLVKRAAAFLTLLVLMAPIMASADFGNEFLENLNDVPKPSDANSALPDVVVNLINIILGFLALIAVVIVLIAGFEWMTAGGNEDKVATAKKRLTYGLIGLFIIFIAYALVTFVLAKLSSDEVIAG